MPVTNFPDGINNGPLQSGAMQSYPALVPTLQHTYFNDFDSYTAGDFVLTSAGSGTAALVAGNNGLLILTNGAANGNNAWLQKTPADVSLVAGKQAWFQARFQVSDANLAAVVVGLQIVGTTPLTATDGVYFIKASGSTAMDFVVRKDATTGSTSATGVGTLANNTMVEVGFHWDGSSMIYAYVGGNRVARINATSAFLPDALNLAPVIGIQNGEAVSKTLTVDYIFTSTDR